ncbi:GNAT family N-acetyltransferase [Pseudonocardiaceae bacterium YIM PH 21723]|nr:GNAT family N-acetyltransferase [Pseudonocardiaceae bacterium YIM PH 21723]
MADHHVRVLTDDELRPSLELFRAATHRPPDSDANWETLRHGYPPGRQFGVFSGDSLTGMAHTFGARLRTPGGVVPMGALTKLGVRADHTRRGIAGALVRHHLRDCTERGEIVAGLRASHTGIYGRFGYGIATNARQYNLRPGLERLHADAPAGGSVRLLDRTEIGKTVPGLVERIGLYRPGMMSRPAEWYAAHLDLPLNKGEDIRFAVHSGPDGDDGFVGYGTVHDGNWAEHSFRTILEVQSLYALTPQVYAGLLRFLLSIDLVDEIRLWQRPFDEPVEWMLQTTESLVTRHHSDELWLRLVDVPAALAARGFPDDVELVLEVRDGFLPENTGRYRVRGAEVGRTTAEPDLTLSASALSSLYLGLATPATLAGAGRLIGRDEESLTRAGRMFLTPQSPWCGTFF